MPSALDQKLQRELKSGALGREPGRKADAYTTKADLEALEEGQDLGQDVMNRLQNRVGNQALNNITSKSGSNAEAGGVSVELEQEEEQQQESEEELGDKDEEGAEHEESKRTFGGSGGGGGAGGAGDPWDLENLFGGDDDAGGGGGPRRRKRMRASPIRNFPGLGAQDLLPPKPRQALEDSDLGGIDLGAPPDAADRRGDAIYLAVEAALSDPRHLGRRTRLEPEDLVDSTGVMDPIGRPAEIGRFLAEAGDGLLSRSLARVLGGPSSALLAEATGAAGAAARLASLTVTTQAIEGGGAAADRAVAVALRRDAWPVAMQAASGVDAFGRLRAPMLLAGILGGDLEDEAALPPDGLDETPIGGRALERVVPTGKQPSIPEIDLSEIPILPEEDEVVSALDALLARMTGGPEAADLPPDPHLNSGHVAPVLEAATGLVNALSRAQVELTAAALAVRRVHPRAPVRGVLNRADEMLGGMARTVVGAGRRLERLVGQPMREASGPASEQVAQLREAAAALPALRVWAMSTLGGTVAA